MPKEPGANWELVVVVWAELDWEFKDRLPILGVLHMENVPGNGVDWESDDGKENRDPIPMIGCSPIVCGTKGLTMDVKVAPTLDEWESPMVDEVDAPSKLEGVPRIVETMVLIEDTIGVAPTERLGLLVFGGGVTPMVDGFIVLMVLGLRLSTVKETMEATVEEPDLSICRGGASSPNVGLFGSK